MISKNNYSKTQISVLVLGDSMVKHFHRWEISIRLQSYCKVYVKQFSVTKTKCTKDYLKPDHFILHVGTNDLNMERSLEPNVKSIIDLAIIIDLVDLIAIIDLTIIEIYYWPKRFEYYFPKR